VGVGIAIRTSFEHIHVRSTSPSLPLKMPESNTRTYVKAANSPG
jgi:hypothetical protein